MKKISAAGNTLVPALLALEGLGFTVSIERNEGSEFVRAVRDEETYSAEDPVTILGLVKLIEVRGWDWRPSDSDLERVMRRYDLG